MVVYCKRPTVRGNARMRKEKRLDKIEKNNIKDIELLRAWGYFYAHSVIAFFDGSQISVWLHSLPQVWRQSRGGQAPLKSGKRICIAWKSVSLPAPQSAEFHDKFSKNFNLKGKNVKHYYLPHVKKSWRQACLPISARKKNNFLLRYKVETITCYLFLLLMKKIYFRCPIGATGEKFFKLDHFWWFSLERSARHSLG